MTDHDEETTEMLRKLCRQLFGPPPREDPDPDADRQRPPRAPGEDVRIYVQELFRPAR